MHSYSLTWNRRCTYKSVAVETPPQQFLFQRIFVCSSWCVGRLLGGEPNCIRGLRVHASNRLTGFRHQFAFCSGWQVQRGTAPFCERFFFFAKTLKLLHFCCLCDEPHKQQLACVCPARQHLVVDPWICVRHLSYNQHHALSVEWSCGRDCLNFGTSTKSHCRFASQGFRSDIPPYEHPYVYIYIYIYIYNVHMCV